VVSFGGRSATNGHARRLALCLSLIFRGRQPFRSYFSSLRDTAKKAIITALGHARCGFDTPRLVCNGRDLKKRPKHHL
jgi:hypothetical protein